MHKISAMAKALKNKTSDVLSAPSRMKHAMRGNRYDSERKIIRDARNYDNAPNYDGSGNITDAFKTRSVAKGIKTKYRLQGGVK